MSRFKILLDIEKTKTFTVLCSLLFVFLSVMTSFVHWIKPRVSASMLGQKDLVSVITAHTNQVKKPDFELRPFNKTERQKAN